MRNKLGHSAFIESNGRRMPFQYPPVDAVEGVDYATYDSVYEFLAAYGGGAGLDGHGFYDDAIDGAREEFIRFITSEQVVATGKTKGTVKYSPSKPFSWFTVKMLLPLATD